VDTNDFAKTIRANALRMVSKANASHIGTCLSMADLLAVLYGQFLNVDPSNPAWVDRDRFILSKGHGTAIVYAALAERGFFPKDWLDNYYQEGSPLAGHISHVVPGVELSTGSLGHGLPVGCGLALGFKRDGSSNRVVVMLSDGELDEGSNWEAILFAPQHALDNLIAIVDYNKIQSLGNVADVLDLHPLADKFRAFRWAVREIDGHDHSAIRDALKAAPFEAGRPSVIVAHTVKGKGVDYMENELLWHYRAPNAEQLSTALSQIGVAQ